MSDHEPESASLPAVGPDGLRAPLEEHAAQRAAVDEAFALFYRTTIRRLVAFLINQGATLPLAADIAQDTMMKAHRDWTGIGEPNAWVHTVAGRALARKVASTREDAHDEVPQPTSLLPHPDAAADWDAQQVTLRMLESLPPRQRQVLAWTYDGFTPSEIAEQLRITPDAVRGSLRDARRAAVVYLRANGYLNEGEEEQ
ncbi:RNA polymerase sigma factor [Planomonospora sp. ID82291]|uniref:RNA polymerase sigma factor n=1 Tax=Planomonospora sp. ID82291 TaxID=2738136 RepID=UPI0018C3BE2E|nr:sigma-70 family RNA polymerase sigma factor [Planomonospora sp. ID82291]MBG0819016.1 sigma-70 family RNA polymerase sigma factor [Planomonospora sp. ID82291]